MILQALVDYYHRKAADPQSGIPPFGFEWKEIPFIIVIDKDGVFVSVEDTRVDQGKVKRGRTFMVPQGPKRAAGVRANLLWDNVEYALGANPRERSDIVQRAEAFRKELEDRLPPREQNERVAALLTFLENSPASQIGEHESSQESWEAALAVNANVTFRMASDSVPLTEIFHEHLAQLHDASEKQSLCIVSGIPGKIEAIHPSIKGVRGAQMAGAALVSFNDSAYTSHGKKQNHNAPISTQSTFAYTTALNALLGRNSTNKLQVGDATTLFWSDKKTTFEDSFASFFQMPPKDNPDEDVQAVQALYKSIETGAAQFEESSQTQFFVLGLAPNAARLSVRFWHRGTVADFSKRLRQHFDDLEIIRSPKDIGRYSLFWLLVEVSSERKVDNVPPQLAGAITRAILEGLPYPAALVQQTIRRIRAEQSVSRMRAAILKACLNRARRTYPTHEKELNVSLDLENMNTGYRLGRLFAALEKIQEDASPGINATIRDRFYGAASASPVTVFPQLLKLKNHHLKKIDNRSYVGAHEKRLGEIFSGLPADMPAHLRMDDQARFAVGYYHQRQAFYVKSSSSHPSHEDEKATTGKTEK